MKNKILALALLLTTFLSFGQHNKESREKITALKVAYLTQELKLNAIEAQQFWPLYNKHNEKIESYKEKGRSKFRKLKSLDNLEEAEAKNLVFLKVSLDKKIIIEKEVFISEVSSFLSYKKIMKLYISEREFARKLMRKYGKGRKSKE
ncbi:sensor of ECF-type sigma factor [Polaribacter sp.]|nr:sensor of ECF-type sigma factor [Polaribacter sp.]